VKILVRVHHEGDFQGEGNEASTQDHDLPRVIYFEGYSVAEAQVRIKGGGTLDALIAGEGTPNDPRQFVLLRRGLRHEGTNCHYSPDGEVFQQHFSSSSRLSVAAQVLV
jgi:hypothetical protein